MTIIDAILTVLFLISAWGWFSNKMAVRGLLYHIGMKYGEEAMPNEEELGKIIKVAMQKTFDDFRISR